MMSKEIMNKDFPNFVKNINAQIEGTQQTYINKIHSTKPHTKNLIIQPQQATVSEKNLKGRKREKRVDIMCRGTKDKNYIDFSSETMQVRR